MRGIDLTRPDPEIGPTRSATPIRAPSPPPGGNNWVLPMTSVERIYNFSAGPSTLPETVLQQARDDLWNVMDSGIGVLEHSHRGPVYGELLEDALRSWRDVGSIPDDYECLFIQGGASLQMAMLPMAFLGPRRIADYLDTGRWSREAIVEARKVGRVNVAGTGAPFGYARVPDESERTYMPHASYLHYCENNTVFGTHVDLPGAPQCVPIVCDASSSFFSRPVDVTRFDMIYGGAQKNLGPSGCAFVVIRKSFLEQARTDLPTMLRYDVHAQHQSRYNTPNTFAVYLMGKMFGWIRELGGLRAVHALNVSKATTLYSHLDRSELFMPTVARPADRSLVNVTFRSTSVELDGQFCREAELAGLSGLWGHPDNGGMRASMYNAFPVDGVHRLVEFMEDFEARTLGRRAPRSTPRSPAPDLRQKRTAGNHSPPSGPT